VKESLVNDGFSITHIAFDSKSKQAGKITQAKRTEKRLVRLFEDNPEDATSIEIYCIEEGIEYLSHWYLLSMYLCKGIYKSSLCAKLSFDFSILDHLKIEKYLEITKKYINWNKEFIFDCGENDIPDNYAICQNPKVIKEIKIISDKNNMEIP
jgi:hypothetical protein